MTDALARIDAASHKLAEAKSLNEVKHVIDIAEAARTYARAAKLGRKAQNHAAELSIRAQRKAGEMFKRLERSKGGRPENSSQAVTSFSEYKATLDETETNRQTANRWQAIAEVPEDAFEQHIAEVQAEDAELTSASVLRVAEQLRREAEAMRHEEERRQNAAKLEQVPTLDEVAGMFSTVVIDPPWDWGDEGDVNQFGRAKPRYLTMPFNDLLRLPVARLAADDAHLYLWITNRSLPKGFELVEAWGFRYVTCVTWVKPHFGMGNYFRGQTEHLLFGVRGSLPLQRHDAGTVFCAPRGPDGHSSKPDEAYTLIESCSPGPYLDMFSRRQREGWMTWGENGISS
jgi:N6-adenosine-specific RNA methylase IME4